MKVAVNTLLLSSKVLKMVQSSECVLEQIFMKDWPQSFDRFIICLKFSVSVR